VNIEEQVELLMQGTEYGDEELKKAMTNELRQRLLDAQKEGRPLRVYCGFDPTSTDFWPTSPCVSCVSFRIWDMMSPF
jgi:tyrosyl-tRNA synthetase